MNAIDPDNLMRFRERLNVAGEYLCSKTAELEAREAYAAVLYVQSSLKLDAEEMKLAAEQEQNPWEYVPKQYAGRWGFDYSDERKVFFVHCRGYSVCESEDSEVCDAICRAHNAWLERDQTKPSK